MNENDCMSADRRADAVVVVVIGLIALAARIAVIAAAPVSPPVSDMLDYWERAVYIAEHGQPLPEQLADARLSNGACCRLRGHIGSIAGPGALVQCGAGRCGGTPDLLAGTTQPRRAAAMGAGLVVAIYPSFLIYSTFVATEAVVTVPLVDRDGSANGSVGLARRISPSSGIPGRDRYDHAGWLGASDGDRDCIDACRSDLDRAARPRDTCGTVCPRGMRARISVFLWLPRTADLACPLAVGGRSSCRFRCWWRRRCSVGAFAMTRRPR